MVAQWEISLENIWGHIMDWAHAAKIHSQGLVFWLKPFLAFDSWLTFLPCVTLSPGRSFCNFGCSLSMPCPGTRCLFPTQVAVFQAFCPVSLLSSLLLKQPMSTCQLLCTYCLQTSSTIFGLLLWPLSGSAHALGSPLLLSTCPGIQRPLPGFHLRGIAFRLLCCSRIPITLLWVPCSLHLPFTVLFLLYLVIDSVTDAFPSLSKAMLTCALQATISFHPHPWKRHFINLLESLWLFSKPCFLLQQNDSFQKMVWWLLSCYSQQIDKGPYISEKTL